MSVWTKSPRGRICILLCLLGYAVPGTPAAADAEPAGEPREGAALSAPAREGADGSDAQHLVVLRRGDSTASDELRTQIDAAFMSSLAGAVPQLTLDVSPVPFEEIELAAGCGGDSAACVQRLAGTLEADWLLVREIAREEDGRTVVVLAAHDGARGAGSRRVRSQVDANEHAPGVVLPALVRSLFATHEAAPPAVERPQPSSTSSPAAIVGWSGAAVSGGLVIAGAVMGALSRKDSAAYKSSEIQTPDDVDRARDILERSQQRGRVANGLFIGAAGAALAGAAGLLWHYLRPNKNLAERRLVQLDLATSYRGVDMAVSYSWSGAL